MTLYFDNSFLTKSTIETKDTIKWKDGKEYPLYNLEISDKSHPFFTGQQNLVDTAGRIEKFNKKYNISSTKKATVEETATEEAPIEEADPIIKEEEEDIS